MRNYGNHDDNVHSATSILKWTYVLVPILAGLDKFTNILTDWSKYLSAEFQSVLPFNAEVFMIIVGIIEIGAGILVLLKPQIGSIVVALWLLAIATNLVLTGEYYDIAVRDTAMAMGAFALYSLTKYHNNFKTESHNNLE